MRGHVRLQAFHGTGFSLWVSSRARLTKIHRLNRLRKKPFLVIPSEAKDLLFFAKTKKKQIPRAKTALRNDSFRFFPQTVKPVLLQITSKSQSLAIRV